MVDEIGTGTGGGGRGGAEVRGSGGGAEVGNGGGMEVGSGGGGEEGNGGGTSAIEIFSHCSAKSFSFSPSFAGVVGAFCFGGFLGGTALGVGLEPGNTSDLGGEVGELIFDDTGAPGADPSALWD